MSSSWERVPLTRQCATCAREPKKKPSVALVPSSPAPIAIVPEPAPPLQRRGHVAAAIEELERQAALIAVALTALKELA